MNDTRNRDKPASQMTKLERVAADILTALQGGNFGQQHTPTVWAQAAVDVADALFDRLEHLPELAHAYDEPDFDHEGTP